MRKFVRAGSGPVAATPASRRAAAARLCGWKASTLRIKRDAGVAATLVLLWCTMVCAQPAADELVAGLKLTIKSGIVTDARPARLIAISVPAGQPPTPFVQPGAFTATWEGLINL